MNHAKEHNEERYVRYFDPISQAQWNGSKPKNNTTMVRAHSQCR